MVRQGLFRHLVNCCIDNETAAAIAALEHLEELSVWLEDQRSYDTLLTCRSELTRAQIFTVYSSVLRHSLMWRAGNLVLVNGVVSCQSGTCNPHVDHLKVDAQFVGFGTLLPRLQNLEIFDVESGVLYDNLQTVLSFCPKVETLTTLYHPRLEVDGSAPRWSSSCYDFGRKEWFLQD